MPDTTSPNLSGGDAAAALANAKGATQTLGQLVSAAQRQAYTVGNIISVNSIGTSLVQVLPTPVNPIQWIVFHNTSTANTLLVGASTLTGLSFSSSGGGFLIFPGDFLPLVGAVSFAWSAIGSGGTSGLTILTSAT